MGATSSRSESLGITFAIDRAKVESAVAVVQREARITRRFHRFFLGSGLALAATLAFAVVVAILHSPTASAEMHVALAVGGGVAMAIAFISWLFLTGSFVFDLALPAVHAWFSRRLRNLGLPEMSLSAPLTLGTGVLRALGAISGAFGGTFLLGATIVLLGRPMFRPTAQPDPDEMHAVMVFLVLGLAMAAWPFINRWRRHARTLGRLKDVASRMTAYLSQDQSAVLQINVSDLNVMARAEAMQIEAQRKEALRKNRPEAGPQPYALRSSRAVLEETMGLNPQAQVTAQERIAGLARDRKPPGAAWDEAAKVWRLAVPDAGVLISYGIDEERREVRLISVGSPVASGGSGEASA